MSNYGRELRQYDAIKHGDQRKAFQIDRDRLIYSSAFRRLAQVTQVVTANEGHVFHNRLTHSLKVAQFARRLAENFFQDAYASDPTLLDKCGGLDPDVVEAAALAHDLGHPPFGHLAEKELDKLARANGLSDGFEGNAQTFRILTRLEYHSSDYLGLNLTRATLNATLKYPWFCERDSGNHRSRKRAKKYSVYDLERTAFEFVRPTLETGVQDDRQTIEASIMDFADDVTYSVHDLEDFYLAGLIPLDILAKDKDEFDNFIDEWVENRPADELTQYISTIEWKEKLKKLLVSYISPGYSPGSIEHSGQIRRVSSGLIQRYIQSVSLQEEYGLNGYLHRPLTEEIELSFLQRVVRQYVLLNPRLATQQYGQRKIIKTLFEIYREAVDDGNVNIIPARFFEGRVFKQVTGNGKTDSHKTRIALDIVAGFSEAEAVLMYRRLTGIDQGSVMDYIR